MMRYGSLFSGIGGFDLGFDRAGMECAWQVEKDQHAAGQLEKHWPGVTRYGDVNDVGQRNLEPVSLICGGFPCQDLSVAGKRAGLDGKRSGLWFEFHRILSELAPEWVVIENVPGLLSSNGGRDFAVLLRGLVELGYGAAWRILDAQYFGVAQRRRRVFIVGHLGSGRAAQVLFERESLPGDTAPGREAGARIANGTLSRALSRVGGGDDPGANKGAALIPVAAPLTARQGKGGFTDPVNDGVIAEKPISFIPGQSADARSLGETENLSVTVKGEGGGAKAHIAYSGGVRRLTPTECERLQGFPDGWTDGPSDTQRYRQLGNAVAVPVAEWLGRRIVEVTNEKDV